MPVQRQAACTTESKVGLGRRFVAAKREIMSISGTTQYRQPMTVEVPQPFAEFKRVSLGHRDGQGDRMSVMVNVSDALSLVP
jgi:hypothetical protein